MHSHRTYPHGLKVEAAKAIFERGMTNQEAMRAFGIKGKTRIETWCRPYQLEGPDAPPPKPVGRPRRTAPRSSPAKRSPRRACTSLNWSRGSKQTNRCLSRRDRAEAADSPRHDYPLELVLDKLEPSKSTHYRYAGSRRSPEIAEFPKWDGTCRRQVGDAHNRQDRSPRTPRGVHRHEPTDGCRPHVGRREEGGLGRADHRRWVIPNSLRPSARGTSKPVRWLRFRQVQQRKTASSASSAHARQSAIAQMRKTLTR